MFSERHVSIMSEAETKVVSQMTYFYIHYALILYTMYLIIHYVLN